MGIELSRGSSYLNMALIRTGGLILKSIKPALSSPFVIPPSSVNLQVRFAARKGYREKKRVKKSAQKASALAEKVSHVTKRFKRVERTVEQKKPPPPEDDIFISDMFNYKKYSISEAILLHREYHHPEIYNNPEAPVTVRIEMNMTAKKSTQFIKPFKGIANIPHPFVVSHPRQILVLCDQEHVQVALDAGATIAGGVDAVKKIQEGLIQPGLYEYVIAHHNFLPKLSPIRTSLKERMPKSKQGTLTSDLPAAIYKFLHGIEYSCIRTGTAEDFGYIECHLGLINMELNQLEENFKALVKDIETHRPPRDGEFITWVWCCSKPSNEEFAIDLSKYVTSQVEDDDFDDDEDYSDAKKNKKKKFRREEESMPLEEMSM